MFGPNLRKEYRSVISEIEDGKPRLPRHNPPSLEQLTSSPLFEEHHKRVFLAFEPFGRLFQVHHDQQPWSIEERNSAAVQDFHGPNYGRGYVLFYNALPVGEVTVAPDLLPSVYDAEFGATLELNVEYLQLIPYADAHQLIWFLFMLIGPVLEGPEVRSRADAATVKLLHAHLWEVTRLPDQLHPFSARIEGPYEFYRDMVTRHKY